MFFFLSTSLKRAFCPEGIHSKKHSSNSTIPVPINESKASGLEEGKKSLARMGEKVNLLKYVYVSMNVSPLTTKKM